MGFGVESALLCGRVEAFCSGRQVHGFGLRLGTSARNVFEVSMRGSSVNVASLRALEALGLLNRIKALRQRGPKTKEEHPLAPS